MLRFPMYPTIQHTANSAFTWLEACNKASEMDAVQYGAEIPEEYCSEVYKDYKEMMVK